MSNAVFDSESFCVRVAEGLVIGVATEITTGWVIIVCVEIPEMTVAIVMTCVVVESVTKLEGFAGAGFAGAGFAGEGFAGEGFATGESAAGGGFGAEGGELESTK